MKHLYARINSNKNIVEYHTEDEKAKNLLDNPPAPLWEMWAVLSKNGWVNCEYNGTPKLDYSLFLHWWYPETDLEILELLLIQHDFKFHRFDLQTEGRWYRLGEESLKKIKRFMKLVGNDDGKVLWNKYAPEDMKME